jgi:hypothetical protein
MQYLIIFLFLTIFVSNAEADGVINRRALVIGIDLYDPLKSGRRWLNLDGCTNDAVSIKEILQSRFDFQGKDIEILKNQEAKRDAILSGFDNLLKYSSKGDVAVIFYAGHGSQVKNSASSENDKRDESIVPADSYLGAQDIRDKELARIFNQFIEKGVILTVIFDCCHSGSIGRGQPSGNPPKTRRIAYIDTYDAMDSSCVEPPENHGVLILSASQDFEPAEEQEDDNGISHGAFTAALLKTLNSLPAISPVTDVYSSIRAILKYNGKNQEPVLAATEARKNQTLLGIDKALLSGKTRVAVIDIDESVITLQGGIAAGLYPKSELVRKDSKGNLMTIEVTANEGLNSCKGRLVSGNKTEINPGDLFELKNWSLPENSALKVFIPPSSFDFSQLTEIASLQKEMEKSGKYKIVENQVINVPSYMLFYDQSKWFLNMPDGQLKVLGTLPEKGRIVQIIPAGSYVCFNIPPTKEIYKALNEKFKGETAIDPVTLSSKAQYFLSGRWKNDVLEYAFVMPQFSVGDSAFNMTLPTETDYFPVTDSPQSILLLADTLNERALKLAKIKAWLALSGPPDDGSFPFHLRLQNNATKKILYSGAKAKNGDILRLLLETDTINVAEWDGTRRYTYVFSIDSKGKMQLIYPLSGSVENRMPMISTTGAPLPQMKLGGVLIKVTEPFGSDSYILLTTNEPISDPGVFNQQGVKSRGGDSNALRNLLRVGSGTRGEAIPPSNWGIQKFVLKSVEN